MLRPAIPVLLVALAACGKPQPRPPRTQFLVLAGDSTFWVRSGSSGMRARGSPIQLARLGGKFYEVFVADDDQSYSDASIVGQQVYRRDLVTGDSLLIFDDTTITGIARWYGRQHPHDHPLESDEEPSDEPHVDAASEFDVLDQMGPYLSYFYRADLTVTGSEEWHVARRGVLDLRDGRSMGLASLFGARAAGSLVRRGRALFSQTLDSILASSDERARQAATAIGDFEFDSTSFSIVERDGQPAVEFVVPGRGTRAGGLTLALPPIGVATPPWWSEARHGAPERGVVPPEGDTTVARWRHRTFRVVSRADSAFGGARLTLVDSTGRAWPIARLPAPARRIYWLDGADVDSATLHALARAFDEAALYSDETRTAMNETDSTERPGRPVRDSQHETSEIMMPQHANNLGHVFGGVILSMLDRTAAVAAIRHARRTCVTVSVDRVDFREPIHLGDLVIMKASVNYAGRTSMEVGVRVEAEDLIGGVRRHTNSCYVTFVAVDRNGRPVEVPRVVPETDDERRRYAAAIERRRRRLEERTAEERS